jgi:hypothetical protein
MKKLKWKNRNIPIHIENKIVVFLKRYKYFNKLTKKDEREIKLYLKRNNITSNVVSFRQIYYIRSQLLRDATNKSYYKLKRKIPKLYNEYLRTNILKLSEKYSCCPADIMRLILRYKQIYNIIELNNYDKKQYKLAMNNDIICNNKNISMKGADKFEKTIERFLKKKNIKFKTQEQLTKEQKTLYGWPLATPDFLLKKPIYINNKKIYWIDAKSSYGLSLPYVYPKLKKQATKYNNIWGNGAFVFGKGVSNKLYIKNTMMLNYFSANF